MSQTSRRSATLVSSLYRAILSELKHRGVIRTENAPVGDYAEYLVATALGGELAPNAEKSWDVLGEGGEKLQVKARVVSDPAKPGQLQLSPFRSFGFDSAVIVLLSATDYAVSRASKVPRCVVESSAIYRQHVNGKILFARPEIMGHPDATDLTATLRAAQNGRQTVLGIAAHEEVAEGGQVVGLRRVPRMSASVLIEAVEAEGLSPRLPDLAHVRVIAGVAWF